MEYETGMMTPVQADAFATQFEEQVGTDYEINGIDDGVVYVICFELETQGEIETCRRIEKEVTG